MFVERWSVLSFILILSKVPAVTIGFRKMKCVILTNKNKKQAEPNVSTDNTTNTHVHDQVYHTVVACGDHCPSPLLRDGRALDLPHSARSAAFCQAALSSWCRAVCPLVPSLPFAFLMTLLFKSVVFSCLFLAVSSLMVF